jgi:hypothetical protein
MTVQDIDFGGFRLATVSGIVRTDRNRDGVYDEDWAGARVFLDKNLDGVRDSNEPTFVVDSSGTYRFDNLRPGQYIVNVELPVGYERKSPSVVDKLTVAESAAVFSDLNIDVRRENIWFNKLESTDVNKDGEITPLDVIVINRLRRVGTSALALDANPEDVPFSFDTNDDQFISPIDVLIIINRLKRRSLASSDGERTPTSSIASAFNTQSPSTNDFALMSIYGEDELQSKRIRKKN